MSRSDAAAGLDTSVLVRLLTGEPAGKAAQAREFMAGIEDAGGRVLVSNLVVAEAYFACQRHYGVPKEEVLNGLRRLLAEPTFLVHPALSELLARDRLHAARPGFLDRLIHAEYAELRLPLGTFEKAAARLANARVLPSAD